MRGGSSKTECTRNKLAQSKPERLGMRNLFWCLLITSMLGGCATPEEREVAALEKELGLDTAPYFPKCLSEEVSPRAAVRAGDYNIAHTVNNPQGEVAIDKCARWETDEPLGRPKDKAEKLILTPPVEAEMPNGRSSDGDN